MTVNYKPIDNKGVRNDDLYPEEQNNTQNFDWSYVNTEQPKQAPLIDEEWQKNNIRQRLLGNDEQKINAINKTIETPNQQLEDRKPKGFIPNLHEIVSIANDTFKTGGTSFDGPQEVTREENPELYDMFTTTDYDAKYQFGSSIPMLITQRHENQGTARRFFNGIAGYLGQTTLTAADTFIEGFVAPVQFVRAIIDTIGGENFSDAVAQRMWNNDYNKFMEGLQDSLDKATKNYQSYSQQNKKWYEDWNFLTNMSMVSDNMKTLGFTMGTMLGTAGLVATGGGTVGWLINMGSKLGKFGKAAKVMQLFSKPTSKKLVGNAIQDSGKAMRNILGQEIKTAEGLVEKGFKGYVNPHGKAMSHVINMAGTLQESGMEARTAAKEYLGKYGKEEDARYQKELALIQQANISEEERAYRLKQAEKTHLGQQNKIKHLANNVGNMTYGLNILTVGPVNFGTFGKYMARPFTNMIKSSGNGIVGKVVKGGAKQLADTGAEKAMQNTAKSAMSNIADGIMDASKQRVWYSKAVDKVTNLFKKEKNDLAKQLKKYTTINIGDDIYALRNTKGNWSGFRAAMWNNLMEGNEELLQNAISSGSQAFYNPDIWDSEGNYISKNGRSALQEFFHTGLATLKNTYLNLDNYQEFLAGAMTGFLPMSHGNPFKLKNWRSSALDTMREHRQMGEANQKAIDFMVNYASNPEYKKYIKATANRIKNGETMQQALQMGDHFEFENAKQKDLYEAISIMHRNGRTDMMKALVENAGITTDENIDDILKETTETMQEWTAEGNPIEKFVGPYVKDGQIMSREEIKQELERKKQQIIDSIDLYSNVSDKIYSLSQGRLDDDAVAHLSMLACQQKDHELRQGEVFSQLSPAFDKIASELAKKVIALQNVENPTDKQKAALNYYKNYLDVFNTLRFVNAYDKEDADFDKLVSDNLLFKTDDLNSPELQNIRESIKTLQDELAYQNEDTTNDIVKNLSLSSDEVDKAISNLNSKIEALEKESEGLQYNKNNYKIKREKEKLDNLTSKQSKIKKLLSINKEISDKFKTLKDLIDQEKEEQERLNSINSVESLTKPTKGVLQRLLGAFTLNPQLAGEVFGMLNTYLPKDQKNDYLKLFADLCKLTDGINAFSFYLNKYMTDSDAYYNTRKDIIDAEIEQAKLSRYEDARKIVESQESILDLINLFHEEGDTPSRIEKEFFGDDHLDFVNFISYLTQNSKFYKDFVDSERIGDKLHSEFDGYQDEDLKAELNTMSKIFRFVQLEIVKPKNIDEYIRLDFLQDKNALIKSLEELMGRVSNDQSIEQAVKDEQVKTIEEFISWIDKFRDYDVVKLEFGTCFRDACKTVTDLNKFAEEFRKAGIKIEVPEVVQEEATNTYDNSKQEKKSTTTTSNTSAKGPRKLTGEDIYEANDKTYLDFDKIGTWNEREIINLFTDDKIKSKIKANELFEYWKELVNNYKGNNPLEKFDFTYIITKLNFGEKNGSIIKYVEKDEDKVVLHDLFLRHFFGIRADGDKIADNDFNRKIQDEKYFKQYLQELLGEIEPKFEKTTTTPTNSVEQQNKAEETKQQNSEAIQEEERKKQETNKKSLLQKLKDFMSSIGIEIVEEENADNAGAGAEFARPYSRENPYHNNPQILNRHKLPLLEYIYSQKYSKDGIDVIRLGGKIYLFDHNDFGHFQNEYRLHQRVARGLSTGPHGYGIRRTFDASNINEQEVKYIIDQLRDEYDTRTIHSKLSSIGIKRRVLHKLDSYIKNRRTEGNIFGGIYELREGTNESGLRGEEDNDLSDDRRDTRNDGIEYLKSSTGEVLGWVEDGKIHLIKGKFDTNTLIHEYAHLWLKALKLGNKKQQDLYASGILKFEKLDIWKEVSNDPNYANLDRDGIFSECVARVTGKRGTELLEKEMDKSLVEEIKDWITKFFKQLQGIFTNKNLNARIGKMSEEDFSIWFSKGIMGDLLNGFNPVFDYSDGSIEPIMKTSESEENNLGNKEAFDIVQQEEQEINKNQVAEEERQCKAKDKSYEFWRGFPTECIFDKSNKLYEIYLKANNLSVNEFGKGPTVTMKEYLQWAKKNKKFWSKNTPEYIYSEKEVDTMLYAYDKIDYDYINKGLKAGDQVFLKVEEYNDKPIIYYATYDETGNERKVGVFYSDDISGFQRYEGVEPFAKKLLEEYAKDKENYPQYVTSVSVVLGGRIDNNTSDNFHTTLDFGDNVRFNGKNIIIDTPNQESLEIPVAIEFVTHETKDKWISVLLKEIGKESIENIYDIKHALLWAKKYFNLTSFNFFFNDEDGNAVTDSDDLEKLDYISLSIKGISMPARKIKLSGNEDTEELLNKFFDEIFQVAHKVSARVSKNGFDINKLHNEGLVYTDLIDTNWRYSWAVFNPLTLDAKEVNSGFKQNQNKKKNNKGNEIIETIGGTEIYIEDNTNGNEMYSFDLHKPKIRVKFGIQNGKFVVGFHSYLKEEVLDELNNGVDTLQIATVYAKAFWLEMEGHEDYQGTTDFKDMKLVNKEKKEYIGGFDKPYAYAVSVAETQSKLTQEHSYNILLNETIAKTGGVNNDYFPQGTSNKNGQEGYVHYYAFCGSALQQEAYAIEYIFDNGSYVDGKIIGCRGKLQKGWKEEEYKTDKGKTQLRVYKVDEKGIHQKDAKGKEIYCEKPFENNPNNVNGKGSVEVYYYKPKKDENGDYVKITGPQDLQLTKKDGKPNLDYKKKDKEKEGKNEKKKEDVNVTDTTKTTEPETLQNDEANVDTTSVNQETSTEKKKKERRGLNRDNRKRLAMPEQVSGELPYEKENIQAAKAWLHSVLPQFYGRVEIIEDLIKVCTNQAAFGLYHDGMIGLSKLAENGTMYHEAFHAVLDSLLTKKELDDLMELGEQEYNLTGIELEEAMAEDFRTYMLSQREPRNWKEKLKRFFSRLVHTVKHYLKLKDSVKWYFWAISEGFYKTRKINKPYTTWYNPKHRIATFTKTAWDKDLNRFKQDRLKRLGWTRELYENLDDNLKDYLKECQ